MSTTTKRRLSDIQAAHERQTRRKGDNGIIEEIRAVLEGVDGQHDLDIREGEDLFTVSLRRMQVADGFDLSGFPGDTLEAKLQSADQAAQGKLSVSDDDRHAARYWIGMFEGI